MTFDSGRDNYERYDMQQSDLETFAAKLDSAAQNAVAMSQITLQHPLTVEEAYQIQRRVVAKRLQRRGQICGLKVGFTSQAKKIQMGVDQVIFGHLISDMQIQNFGEVSIARTIHPRVEPELAFRLAEDVDYVLSPASALSTVDAIAPAMEIIDSRYQDFQFSLTDVIADNSSSSHFVVGDWRPPKIDVANLSMTLSVDDRPPLTGYSHEISGHPINSLVELSALAVRHGIVLKAGWIILAGAATEAIAIRGANRASCSVAGLGDVEVYIG